MTQAVAKFAAKKLLSKEMDKYKSKDVAGPYDPYYQYIDHPRKPGKKKKVKKQIPSYIPAHDAEILAAARKRAYHLDLCLFNFLGIRFGWSSVVGLVPAAGDALDMLFAVALVRKMKKADCALDNTILIRMMINILFDFVIGLIPFVGDLADAAIKCNTRNVRLFEQVLDKAYKPKALKDRDDALPEGRRPAPATEFEDFSDEEEERRATFEEKHDRVKEPKRAYSGRRQREPDVEMGYGRQDTGVHRNGDSSRPSRNNTRNSKR